MKTVGILIIFALCTILGFSLSSAYKKRAEQLEAFRELIVFIKAHIESYRTPIDRIFSLYKNKCLDKCGFLSAVRQCGGDEAIKKCSGQLFLSDTDVFELSNFFSRLGGYDGENAVKHCSYYEKMFDELLIKAREDAASKSRVCRALGFLAGIMVAVLFI